MSSYTELDLQRLVQDTDFNPSANSPLYHNYTHLNAVYQLAQVLSTGLRVLSGVKNDLYCAALLHDVDHSLDPDLPDEENVARAMRKAEEADRLLPGLFNLRRVQSLILATEFPDPTAKLDILDSGERALAEILIDADILSALTPMSLNNIVNGLRREKRFTGTPAEWVEKNNAFLASYKARTQAGREYHAMNVERTMRACREAVNA